MIDRMDHIVDVILKSKPHILSLHFFFFVILVFMILMLLMLLLVFYACTTATFAFTFITTFGRAI